MKKRITLNNQQFDAFAAALEEGKIQNARYRVETTHAKGKRRRTILTEDAETSKEVRLFKIRYRQETKS